MTQEHLSTERQKVEVLPNGDKKLYSYGKLVAEIKDGQFINYGKYSKTTSRHQREFARQEGFDF